jgi:hypothetical protein
MMYYTIIKLIGIILSTRNICSCAPGHCLVTCPFQYAYIYAHKLCVIGIDTERLRTSPHGSTCPTSSLFKFLFGVYIHFLLPKATFFSRAQIYRYLVFTVDIYFALSQRYSGSHRFPRMITCIVHNSRGTFLPISVLFLGKNTQKLFRQRYTKVILLIIQHHGSGLLTSSSSTSFSFTINMFVPLGAFLHL